MPMSVRLNSVVGLLALSSIVLVTLLAILPDLVAAECTECNSSCVPQEVKDWAAASGDTLVSDCVCNGYLRGDLCECYGNELTSETNHNGNCSACSTDFYNYPSCSGWCVVNPTDFPYELHVGREARICPYYLVVDPNTPCVGTYYVPPVLFLFSKQVFLLLL